MSPLSFLCTNPNKRPTSTSFTALVEAVELRIAGTRTDAELTEVLGRFLAPLLLKIASPDATVRQRVRSIPSTLFVF